jgi:FkbM family methyltransferase
VTFSLLVIACNEEHRLRACIDSARPVVDQVVVVVQHSHDATLTLARELADAVIEHPCHGTSEPSRPAGLAACTGEWVLNLDADEELTEAGRMGLAKLANLPASVGLFHVRLKVWAGDHLLEDSRRPRLFRPDAVQYGLECHSAFQAKPGFTDARVTSEHAWIESRKTWAEQKSDDARYARLTGATRSALYPSRPFFREGTTDRWVWDSIVGSGDEYQLPPDLTGWTVLDIGAHIGSFAQMCLNRGAAFVLCVEPDRSTFDVLCHNLAPHGSRVACVRAAAWRSDRGHENDRLCPSGFGPRGPECNPGAATVLLSGDYEEVAALAFDRLVSMCGSGGEIDLVKLDCEGSEGPILHTATTLHRCRRVVGEWHDMHYPAFQAHSPVDDVVYSIGSISSLLSESGFQIKLDPKGDIGLGLFSAVREGEK